MGCFEYCSPATAAALKKLSLQQNNIALFVVKENSTSSQVTAEETISATFRINMICCNTLCYMYIILL